MSSHFSELRRIQKEFIGLVFAPKFTTPKRRSSLRNTDPGRLELYRDVTLFLLQEAMEWIYPMVHRVVVAQRGEKSWSRLAKKGIVQFPPTHYALIPSVSRFPKVFKEGSWLREFAEYDLAQTQARNGEGSYEKKKQPPWINPSLKLMSFRHEISAWYKTLAHAKSADSLLTRPQRAKRGGELVAVFCRHDDETVRTLELHPVAFAFLTLCQAGMTPEQALRNITRKLGADSALKEDIQNQLIRLFDHLTEEKALSANPLTR